jgi:hypothetical protein
VKLFDAKSQHIFLSRRTIRQRKKDLLEWVLTPGFLIYKSRCSATGRFAGISGRGSGGGRAKEAKQKKARQHKDAAATRAAAARAQEAAEAANEAYYCCARPLHRGPCNTGGETEGRLIKIFTVAEIRTILLNAPGGILAYAIQKKLSGFNGVSAALQHFLDEHNGMDSCWTRRSFPAYGKAAAKYRAKAMPFSH